MKIFDIFSNDYSKTKQKRHLPFQPSIIWCAILMGLLGGFALGSYLVFIFAYNLTPDKSFPALIQIHGHLQLIGWTGFFIIGVSLYKMPRLMSCVPLRRSTSNFILTAMILGLLLRTLGQIFIQDKSLERDLLRNTIFIGCFLESLGITIFVVLLLPKLIRFNAQPGAYAAASLKPFLLVSFSGWLIYAIFNIVIALNFLFNDSIIFDPVQNEIATNIYVYLVLLPTCFAFSTSIFPIFLRLRAPIWPVRTIALTYAIGAFSYLISVVIIEFHSSKIILELFMKTGLCVRILATLWFVSEIDLLRIRDPWFTKFREKTERENRPPRKFASDYGQFGNFELLIYSAYFWLVIASLYELFSQFMAIGMPVTIIRHFYLLGFVTHLILGMAVRMIPGFLGQNRIAFPNLVRLSLLFITISILGRTFPLVFGVTDYYIFRFLYGYSGVFAMLAITSLAVNLVTTVWLDKALR
ncbi:MAG: hypothetical protein KBC84_06655 [Proteobacteria bacterium]|jgi:uncharacterized protein involved in response to NO|nr:hypothetical protein [Pseudomonadota bacterium]